MAEPVDSEDVGTQAPDVQTGAAADLAMLGPSAVPALRALRAAFRDPSARVRGAAT